MYSIGLMSGTSMDGIDCALIETDGTPDLVRSIAHHSFTYDSRFHLILKATEYTVQKHQGSLTAVKLYFENGVHDFLKSLNTNKGMQENTFDSLSQYLRQYNLDLSFDSVITHSTRLHAQVVQQLLKENNLAAEKIDVIGYHGQTLYHRPLENISIIIGNGQELANVLKIPVVNDFRSNDIRHGGVGAPFAPIYHQALAIRDGFIPSCVVNCGGISNITYIPNDSPSSLIAFDTGPGNALIDRFVRIKTQGQAHMDKNGLWGSQGSVNQPIFQALYERSIIVDNKNYLDQKPPKSLDTHDLLLVPEIESLSLEDGCRTLEAFTAETIVNSLKFLDVIPLFWILAGGGWHNPVIKEELVHRLSNTYSLDFKLHTADAIHWQNQALEAEIFAFLAVRHLKNLPLSFPETTRVKTPTCGGILHKVCNPLF